MFVFAFVPFLKKGSLHTQVSWNDRESVFINMEPTSGVCFKTNQMLIVTGTSVLKN